ncbi:MAG: 3-oxoacyl-ACP reductase FabG [Sodalinema sp.]|uniref:3-oxoacyl-ACP reductase FabG n=1 Tax=Sodalinema sp. TaxID=3080550 RepID=UPI0012202A7B|nr:MAG: 3-oxoacyl-ACP reductase FabG [Phormidium sp. SL48-SHIP]
MKGQTVLLTGGTGGLGMGVTPKIVAQGASITIPYRNTAEVDRLKQQMSPEDFSKIQFVLLDLLDESAVRQLIEDMGRVDVLIHLVGGFSMGATHEYDYSDWRKDLDLNLNTTFLACKYSLAQMRQQGYGRIVTVGSRGAVEPGAQLAAYCAAKAAVVALTKSIAAETQNTGITANCVLPSVIDTPSNRAAMGDDNADTWVKPSSLADVICFLASEAARDVRGAAVPVYGDI